MNVKWEQPENMNYIRFGYDWSSQFKYQESWVKESLMKSDQTLWKLFYKTDSGWNEFKNNGEYSKVLACGKVDKNELAKTDNGKNYMF